MAIHRFFAGSGTVGRVCITEGRHCLMCDSDNSSTDYFSQYLDLMRRMGQSANYEPIDSTDNFFIKLEGEWFFLPY